jgi:hypothetical protein
MAELRRFTLAFKLTSVGATGPKSCMETEPSKKYDWKESAACLISSTPLYGIAVYQFACKLMRMLGVICINKHATSKVEFDP